MPTAVTSGGSHLWGWPHQRGQTGDSVSGESDPGTRVKKAYAKN